MTMKIVVFYVLAAIGILLINGLALAGAVWIVVKVLNIMSVI